MKNVIFMWDKRLILIPILVLDVYKSYFLLVKQIDHVGNNHKFNEKYCDQREESEIRTKCELPCACLVAVYKEKTKLF